jgi:hypothetical protein
MAHISFFEKCIFVFNLDIRLEPISKKGKWFEVKPPARWAYAPEGKAIGSEESRLQVGILLKKKPNRLFHVTRRNICEYFEDYDSSLTPRSSHLTFLRWVLRKTSVMLATWPNFMGMGR